MKPDSLIANSKDLFKDIHAENLAEAFEAFSKSSAELIEYYSVLERRIAELTDQLERSKRLAVIGEMSATLAHEIRNPLAGIELSASMLGKGLTDVTQKELVFNILSGVKRLNGIISDILCFAQELKVNPRDVNVREVIIKAIGILKYKLDTKTVYIDLNIPSFHLKLDPSLMERVFVNLLENAIDAVPEDKGCIGLELKPFEDKVEIFIWDNGPGIAALLREKIFEPFFTTKEKGTGLGLSICQRIVNAHGGELTYCEQDKHMGFKLCLPVY